MEVVWSWKKFPAMKYWSISWAFVKTGYNDRSGFQMSTRGWVQPLVTLVLCWASQSFALPPPRVLDPIVPRRTSSQAKGAQENQRKLRPEQKSKNEKYTWRTLWGNKKPPDMLNTPCMSFCIEAGLRKKQGSQKCCSLLQLLKAGGFWKLVNNIFCHSNNDIKGKLCCNKIYDFFALAPKGGGSFLSKNLWCKCWRHLGYFMVICSNCKNSSILVGHSFL